MSRRLFTRTVVLAALAGTSSLFAVTPAHAAAIITDPSASATLACSKATPNVLSKPAWGIDMSNGAGAVDDAPFSVFVDGKNNGHNYKVSPGQTIHADIWGASDGGKPSHVVVTSGATTLVDKTGSLQCNFPQSTITFSCNHGAAHDAMLWFESIDWSDGKYDVVWHWAHGGTWTSSKGEAGASEVLPEDEPYHATITQNGKVVAHADGVANCHPNAPATTTTIATLGRHADPPTTVNGAAPAKTLPFTGSSNGPLTGLGLALVGAGAAAIACARRKARTA